MVLLHACNDHENIACVPDTLQNDIVAFYDFSGGTLLDKSGSNRTLSNHNRVTFADDRDGNAFCAARFNSELDQVLYTDGGFTDHFQDKEFSISLWYSPEPTLLKYESLIGRSMANSKLGCPSKLGEWTIGLHDCKRAVASVHKNTAWENQHPLWLDSTIVNINKCDLERAANTGVWKHVVATYHNRSISIYVNGAFHKTGSIDACGRDSENIGDLVIGKFYTGYIDDIIIFNKKLSAGEVLQLYQTAPCCE